MRCYAMLNHIIHVLSCHVMLLVHYIFMWCYIIMLKLRYDTLRYVVFCWVLSCHVASCHLNSRQITLHYIICLGSQLWLTSSQASHLVDVTSMKIQGLSTTWKSWTRTSKFWAMLVPWLSFQVSNMCLGTSSSTSAWKLAATSWRQNSKKASTPIGKCRSLDAYWGLLNSIWNWSLNNFILFAGRHTSLALGGLWLMPIWTKLIRPKRIPSLHSTVSICRSNNEWRICRSNDEVQTLSSVTLVRKKTSLLRKYVKHNVKWYNFNKNVTQHQTYVRYLHKTKTVWFSTSWPFHGRLTLPIHCWKKYTINCWWSYHLLLQVTLPL